jgi:hypothetical protein
MELLYAHTSFRYYFISRLLIAAKVLPDAMSKGSREQWWSKYVAENFRKYP